MSCPNAKTCPKARTCPRKRAAPSAPTFSTSSLGSLAFSIRDCEVLAQSSSSTPVAMLLQGTKKGGLVVSDDDPELLFNLQLSSPSSVKAIQIVAKSDGLPAKVAIYADHVDFDDLEDEDPLFVSSLVFEGSLATILLPKHSQFHRVHRLALHFTAGSTIRLTHLRALGGMFGRVDMTKGMPSCGG
eukprot:gnl/Dysnectes_brevis/633_a700_3269.p1 GENE.gnl/Dysnectes_brevis/633_a700_3269~~gnl/Dysnectes_brevis/633_a700_3269.p1  ORF type:complete len:186 (-),score=50.59 gnl/Dysnectes_brevis/633_a700_3269:162-719(-)